jgi:hypothetical protein
MYNWISTEKRLPDDDRDVLAFVKYDSCPITAYYNDGKWRVGYQVTDYIEVSGNGYKESTLHEYEVTHWQPLPPPPKNLETKTLKEELCMTPKIKAIDLIQKFEGLTAKPFDGEGNMRASESVKERATICCDEIIAFMQDATSIMCYDGGEILEPRQYWAQVKQHIQSL